MKTKWNIKVGHLWFPAGTPIKQATLEEAMCVFPKIELDDRSEQIAVWFPEMSHPTVIHIDQVEV